MDQFVAGADLVYHLAAATDAVYRAEFPAHRIRTSVVDTERPWRRPTDKGATRIAQPKVPKLARRMPSDPGRPPPGLAGPCHHSGQLQRVNS